MRGDRSRTDDLPVGECPFSLTLGWHPSGKASELKLDDIEKVKQQRPNK